MWRYLTKCKHQGTTIFSPDEELKLSWNRLSNIFLGSCCGNSLLVSIVLHFQNLPASSNILLLSSMGMIASHIRYIVRLLHQQRNNLLWWQDKSYKGTTLNCSHGKWMQETGLIYLHLPYAGLRFLPPCR